MINYITRDQFTFYDSFKKYLILKETHTPLKRNLAQLHVKLFGKAGRKQEVRELMDGLMNVDGRIKGVTCNYVGEGCVWGGGMGVHSEQE